MDLSFDSVAIFDEKSDAVKFAGRYLDKQGKEQFVICRVTSDFLAKHCNLRDPTPDAVLDAYISVRDFVNDLILKRVAAGDRKPVLDLGDLKR